MSDPAEAPLDPEELDATGAPAGAEISPQTSMGAVELTVSDLGRSLDYYRSAVGLEVLEQEDGRASLGAGGRELLVLVEEPGARPAVGYTGLYHFALLLPERVRPRPLARARGPRPRTADRALRPLRQRGALPLGPGRARDRDLLGPAPERLGGTGRRPADDAAARHGGPARRARGPGGGAVRRPARGHDDGPRPSKGVVDPGDAGLLPRPARLRPDGRARQLGGLPRRRWVSPPRRRQHVGERRRGEPTRRDCRASPSDHRPAGQGRAGPRPRPRRRRQARPSSIRPVSASCSRWPMPRGYMEGPAAEEAERRLEELERRVEDAPTERLAVFGATADNPERALHRLAGRGRSGRAVRVRSGLGTVARPPAGQLTAPVSTVTAFRYT